MSARVCALAIGFLAMAAKTATGDPVVLKPAATLELVDFAPIDGLNLLSVLPD